MKYQSFTSQFLIKIDCTSSSERLLDVLGVASSNTIGSTGAYSIRDMGKGRGCVVLGLTEVAIFAATDVDSIIKNVITTRIYISTIIYLLIVHSLL